MWTIGICRTAGVQAFAWRVSTSGMEWISTATRLLPATSGSSNASGPAPDQDLQALGTHLAKHRWLGT